MIGVPCTTSIVRQTRMILPIIDMPLIMMERICLPTAPVAHSTLLIMTMIKRRKDGEGHYRHGLSHWKEEKKCGGGSDSGGHILRHTEWASAASVSASASASASLS